MSAMTPDEMKALIEDIRSEAVISSRPGQMDRLEAIADSLAALSAHPAEETVMTIAEVSALPVGSVVLSADDEVCVRVMVQISHRITSPYWQSPGWEGIFTAPDIALPARVLYRPVPTDGEGR